MAPKAPKATAAKTYLDIINKCDNFPYFDPNPNAPTDVTGLIASYWKFHLANESEPVGYMVPSTVAAMPWTEDFDLCAVSNTIRLNPKTSSSQSKGKSKSKSKSSSKKSQSESPFDKAVQSLLDLAVTRKTFPSLKKLHSKRETYPVLGTRVPLNIDRAACFLFGIVTAGAHMTVYTQAAGANGAIKIWVPRRAWTKSKDPGMLDNSVAGGIASGEMPKEAIVREAVEEAGLDEEVIRTGAVSCGAVMYFHRKAQEDDGVVGGDLEPRIRYVYDLKVTRGVELKPSDGEVEGFELQGVDWVREKMFKGSSRWMRRWCWWIF